MFAMVRKSTNKVYYSASMETLKGLAKYTHLNDVETQGYTSLEADEFKVFDIDFYETLEIFLESYEASSIDDVEAIGDPSEYWTFFKEKDLYLFSEDNVKSLNGFPIKLKDFNISILKIHQDKNVIEIGWFNDYWTEYFIFVEDLKGLNLEQGLSKEKVKYVLTYQQAKVLGKF